MYTINCAPFLLPYVCLFWFFDSKSCTKNPPDSLMAFIKRSVLLLDSVSLFLSDLMQYTLYLVSGVSSNATGTVEVQLSSRTLTKTTLILEWWDSLLLPWHPPEHFCQPSLISLLLQLCSWPCGRVLVDGSARAMCAEVFCLCLRVRSTAFTWELIFR